MIKIDGIEIQGFVIHSDEFMVDLYALIARLELENKELKEELKRWESGERNTEQ